MNNNSCKLQEIVSILPPIVEIKVRSEAEFYGASSMVATKINLNETPKTSASWKHGWTIADLRYTEQITIGQNALRYLVPLKRDELFLQEKGFKAKAVGMPFVYAKEADIQKIHRVKNSLLVMPSHSLPYTSHGWDEGSYASEINALKSNFDLIVVCIHQSCVTKRLWIDTFEKYEIPWIIGADAQDRNSLLRMHRLFSSFEYMTTNAIGSHVVYAAYSGCKVSIYGDYAEYSSEDYQDDPFYNRFPFLLEYNLKYTSKDAIIKKFPFLFTHPKKAKSRVEWAQDELGEINKVSFEELSQLLGWGYWDNMIWFLKRAYFKIVGSFGQVIYKKKRGIS